MAYWPRRSEGYRLLTRTSSDSTHASDTGLGYDASPPKRPRTLRLPGWSYFQRRPTLFWAIQNRISLPSRKRQACYRILCYVLAAVVCFTIILIFLTALFQPSYTYLPAHYKALQKICSASPESGRGNINNEKVFIAAALYDPGGSLLDGAWASSVLSLVDLLGPDNVHLSIYENDADEAAKAALHRFKSKVSCECLPQLFRSIEIARGTDFFKGNNTIVSEHLTLKDIHSVTVPSGQRRMKRIAFLAEVRNRALRPLEADPSVQFDRLLFINDVMFNPVDAIHLLFSTNVDASGRAQYGAVCAMDFINAFKFYDRFATRDLEGYAMGIPFFPWFTDAGNGLSRQDVLDQKDAVRVRACWGGMTAFEAKWFLETHSDTLFLSGSDSSTSTAFNVSPLRFRYEEDPFWDASECCLIHADLTYLRHGHNITTGSDIYTNPYIRVAYDSRTLSWLSFTRRTERLYSFIHNILNHMVGMPYHNPRRLEEAGDEVVEKVWSWDQTQEKVTQDGAGNTLQGTYHDVKRVAGPGRFCGGRTLLVLNDDPKPGEKKWMSVPLPALPN
jgi:hypothetical protein